MACQNSEILAYKKYEDNWNGGESAKFDPDSDILICHIFPILALSFIPLVSCCHSRDSHKEEDKLVMQHMHCRGVRNRKSLNIFLNVFYDSWRLVMIINISV